MIPSSPIAHSFSSLSFCPEGESTAPSELLFSLMSASLPQEALPLPQVSSQPPLVFSRVAEVALPVVVTTKRKREEEEEKNLYRSDVALFRGEYTFSDIKTLFENLNVRRTNNHGQHKEIATFFTDLVSSIKNNEEYSLLFDDRHFESCLPPTQVKLSVKKSSQKWLELRKEPDKRAVGASAIYTSMLLLGRGRYESDGTLLLFFELVSKEKELSQVIPLSYQIFIDQGCRFESIEFYLVGSWLQKDKIVRWEQMKVFLHFFESIELLRHYPIKAIKFNQVELAQTFSAFIGPKKAYYGLRKKSPKRTKLMAVS